jgi:uncharacterized membrane protein YgdD (TMEM256/DUF423 family)|tara:strand:- start:135 stop:506 length:372 start_codon:yes stop_codon:yes gene_type:complete
MTSEKVLKTASVFGVLAVAIGAFGAHGLESILIENNRVETFETAVQYHFYHTIALLIVAVLLQNKASKCLNWAAILFSLGILLFSGSLYILALSNFTFLGAITPLGGLCFIAAWAALYCSAKE